MMSYVKTSFNKPITACFNKFSLIFMVLSLSCGASAQSLKIGDPAPSFKVKNQDGAEFDLSTRKGKWTVLFFYPKAGTPGCTTQACAFRDNLKLITDQGAEVFGISTDTIEEQKKFAAENKIPFTLLSDADGKVTNLFGAKIPMMKMSRRWTFIIDPELKIRSADRDVDPALDAKKVADLLTNLKKP